MAGVELWRESNDDCFPTVTAEEDRAGRSPVSAAEARAAVEARRTEARAAHAAKLRTAFGAGVPGRPTIWATWVATSLQALVSVLALVEEDRFLAAFLLLALGLFVIGALLFAVDIVLAAARSTRDSMGIGGLFFCAGSAPRWVAVSFNTSLATAVVVCVATALSRLSTPEFAFGTLVPILQLSLSGFWGVRHGMFEARGTDHDAVDADTDNVRGAETRRRRTPRDSS
ncbi:MAG: hypothetical protein ACR2OH_03160 [Microthrixaceae bacterium]